MKPDACHPHGAGESHHGRPRFYYFAIVISLLTLALSAIPVLAIRQSGGRRKVASWEAQKIGGVWVVTYIEPLGRVSESLKPGDRILAINGDRRAENIGPLLYLTRAAAGSEYQITVDRAGREINYPLKLTALGDPESFYLSLGELVEGYGFFLTGLLIVLLKSRERLARIAFINATLCALYIFALACNSERGMLSPAIFGFALLLYAVAPFHWVGGYFFYSAFPFQLNGGAYWRVFGRALLICGTILWIPLTFSRVILVVPAEWAYTFALRYPMLMGLLEEPVRVAFRSFIVICIAGILSSVVSKYRSMAEGDLRRRIRWVAWGAVVGLLPIMTINLIRPSLTASGLAQQFETGMFVANRICDLVAIIVPITIAYAIIKHRVLGVRVALRIGLQYLLAKNVLRILLILPLAALAVIIARNPHTTLLDLLLAGPAKVNLGFLILGVLCLRYRSVLSYNLDRRFFREAFRQEQILTGLTESIRKVETIPAISRLLAREIDQALHPQVVYSFFRLEGDQEFSLLFSSETPRRDLHVPSGARLLHVLESRHASITEREWQRDTDSSEIAWLEDLGAKLAVPIMGTDFRLTGLLLLGEKKSEEPYLQRDRLLLETISTQIGVVCENLVLREHVSRERQMQDYMRALLKDRQISIVRECPACGSCYDSSASVCSVDGTELKTNLPVERVIQSKYRLDRLIGRGGMGTVYQAVDLRLGRKVAVKIMAVSLFGDAAARRRFAREARACARLDHPNIVRIYDFGDIECGGAFLVLEYVPGANLRRELPNLRGKPARTVQILSQVLNAVEAAHAAGIIHRDLKPENILLIGGQPVTIAKVADFGLAKIRDSEAGDPGNQISMERSFGTAGYMAPEQCYGQEIDARADLYSLGAITLELLGGTVPSSPVLSHAQIHETVDQLGTLSNTALRQVLHQSLALQREERYQNVAAFRAALMPALEIWASMAERLQQDTAISGQSFLANQPTLARRVGK